MLTLVDLQSAYRVRSLLVTSRDSSESLMKLMSLGRLWYWIEIHTTV